MEVVIQVDNTNAVQLARHLAGTIVKDYKVFEAIKKMLLQLRFPKGLSAEEEDEIRNLYHKFEKNQLAYFLWGTKEGQKLDYY